MKRTLVLLACAVVAVTSGLSLAGPVEDLPAGQWYEVPNSRLRSVLPNPLPPGNPKELSAI